MSSGTRGESDPNRGGLVLVCFTGKSGLTDYSICMARALSRLAPTALYTSEDCGHDFDGLGFSIKRVFRRTRHLPVDLPRFVTRLRRDRPSALIFQGPLRFPVLDALIVLVFRALGIRCIAVVHDVLPHYPSPLSRGIFGFYYRAFNGLILHSQKANLEMDALNRSAPRLTVPHGPYDMFRIGRYDRDSARRSFGFDAHSPQVILFFGHLESRKGLKELLQFAETNAEAGNPQGLHFLIAGPRSPHRADKEVNVLLEQLKSEPTVTIVAERIDTNEVERYFLSADIVALPYKEGTTSGILKIAIAFGIPTIVSDVGDLLEQVPSGSAVMIPGEVSASKIQKACISFLDERRHRNASLVRFEPQMGWEEIAGRVSAFVNANPGGSLRVQSLGEGKGEC
jgi:glycosyltransferase involved in cell wall biosynthesis